jgi:hypothetical protein
MAVAGGAGAVLGLGEAITLERAAAMLAADPALWAAVQAAGNAAYEWGWRVGR